MTECQRRSRQVLVVEDNIAQCELLDRAFAQHAPESQPLIAQDEETALAFLEAGAAQPCPRLPRLVLLDLKLARGSGLALLRRLRAHPRLAFLPVVILTSSDDEADIRACYAEGANGYVVKPDTFSQLVALADDLRRYWLGWNRTAHRPTASRTA
jgi:CheY-like chemotaxis protein